MIQSFIENIRIQTLKPIQYIKKYQLLLQKMMGVKQLHSSGKEVTGKEFPAIFFELQNSLNKDTSSLYLKITKAIIGNYSQQQNKQIKDLIQIWSDQFMKLEEIIYLEENFTEKSINYYLSIDCLAARVYLKITDYFVRIRSYNNVAEEQIKDFEEFRNLLNKEELVFSYDRFFWGRRTVKSKFYSEQNEKERVQAIKKSLKKVFECVDNCSNATLKKVYQFMLKLQLVNLQEQIEINNRLILRLQRISKEDQKIQFLHSLQANYLQGLFDIQHNKIKSEQQKSQILKSISKKLSNYEFYSLQKQKNINTLHAKIGDYQFLQQRHDYIQWMFPNHYGSAFNSQSSPLSYLQKRLFIDDQAIGFRMLKSIYLFLDFMGISLSLKDLSLKIISKPRLRAVILVNFHNHLRIMRILACLSVIGFRKIALNLIKLLDEQTSQKGFLSKQREQFQRSWDIYGDESPSKPRKKAKQMCFHEDDLFPQDHSVIQLLHTITLKQKNKQLMKEPQLQKFIISEDLQDFNPQTNQRKEVLNIAQVPKVQNTEKNDGLPQVSEPEKYLTTIEGTQIAAINITVKPSE